MKLYVVFEGEYSDRSCVGAFSTREKALEVYGELASDEEFMKLQIEEHELDGVTDYQWCRYWVAKIRLSDGATTPAYETRDFRKPSQRGQVSEPYPWFWQEETKSPRVEIIRAESLVSPAHAVKLAVEARQAWLRARSPQTQP
jgi:hypothetical protein